MALVEGSGKDLDGDGVIEALEGIVRDAGEDLDGDGVIEAIEGIVNGIKVGVFPNASPEELAELQAAISGAAEDPGDVVEGAKETVDPETGEVTIEALGILSGGDIFQVQINDLEDRFIIAFDTPDGKTVYFEFKDFEEVIEVYGDAASVPTINKTSELDFQTLLETGDLLLAGDAAEISGTAGAGSFDAFYRRVQDETLLNAGITDPSLRGKLLDDPEVQAIMTLATMTGGTAGDISAAGILADLRNTSIWKDDIYAGIDFFYQRGDDPPEAAWRDFQATVENGLRELGIQADPDGTWRSTIKEMLDGGVDKDEFTKFLPTFIEIQNNPGLKDQLDAWAVFELGSPLSFDDFMEVLQGTEDAELSRVIESAGLAFQAEQAGFNISNAEIRKLAENTNLTDREALAAFTDTEAVLLAIGDQQLGQFGISQGDFLDVAAGQAPRSGKGAAEVRNLASKLATERGLSDDPRGRFFLGFSDRGQAQRIGLAPLTGEGG